MIAARKLASLAVFLLLGMPAFAHPGVSVVVDSKGNVYYTDLKQVWRVAPDGKRTVAVADVHTHELYLDPQDNLYGENLWYESENTQFWHTTWKLNTNGKLERLVPPTKDFRTTYSFVRDRAGNHYYYRDKKLFRTGPDGKESFIAGGAAGQADGKGASAGFEDFRWIFAAPEGTVYAIDHGRLRRIAPDGSVVTLWRSFTPLNRRMLWVGDRHALMGLHADAEGNVFVANCGAQMVEKIGKDGKQTVFLRSTYPWGPTGVTVKDGDVYVLEYQINAVRVRKVGKDGSVTAVAE